MRDLPIGVFDSGVGGLTVLGALQRQLPAENFLYLGDTARLPYGTKTPATVERYALQAVAALVQRGVKAVVVACNTASAAALPALAVAFPQLPLLGVIEPGAAAAVAASRTGRIAVIATEGTVRGEAYQLAIHRLNPAASVTAVAATLFVALAEEGWVTGPVAESIARRYLGRLFAAAGTAPDVLVLGCTHFPAFDCGHPQPSSVRKCASWILPLPRRGAGCHCWTRAGREQPGGSGPRPLPGHRRRGALPAHWPGFSRADRSTSGTWSGSTWRRYSNVNRAAPAAPC